MFLSLVVAGCYPAHDARVGEALPRKVQVREVHASPAPDSPPLVGRIEPWREAILYFEVAGTVTDVFVEEGDRVEAGAPIARIDPTDYRLAVARAKAERDAAVAAWELLKAGTRKEDLEAARADFDRAKARLTFWKSEYERARRVYEKRSISLSEFEKTQRQYDAALQDMRAAKAALDRAVAGPREEDVAAAAARVDAQEQALALAQRQLDKTTLKAPFAGWIDRRLLDPGAYINVFPTGGVPVVHLVDLRQADAVIAVPEVAHGRFRVGDEVDIRAAVEPDLRVTGKVLAVSRVADRTAGTFALRVRLPNEDRRLLGGMVVTARRHGAAGRPAIRIPLTAVRRAYGESPYVLIFLPESQRVARREIELGAIDGNRVEVVRGLAEGDLLVVRGQHAVVTGDRVRVAASEHADPPAGGAPERSSQRSGDASAP